MKRITLISLFFCLAITTVLAQVVTNIETPDSNGLSNNQVDDFDVATDGTILNNSAADGTAQLGTTAVTANPNITVGSEADLILFQVTGSSGSDLDGTIEVFGSEAGIIIANPNGIDCDGCGFINTNRVDLVTGTANFSGDDLTGFSIDDAAIFFVRNTGFVSDAVTDELNLVSRDLRIQAQAKANTTLRVLAGNDTYDHTTNIITSGTTEVSTHSIQINASGYLEANYIELISTEISSSHGILNAGGDIETGRLKLDSNGLFRNQEGGGNLGDINISGLLEVITADRFINNGNITADTLTITTDEFFNNHNGTTQLGKIFVIDTFSLSTPNASYTNTGTVTSDSLNLITSGDFVYNSTTLNSFTFNNLAITTEGDFTSYADIDIAGDLSIQVSGEASLDVSNTGAVIKARNLFFSAYDLWNQADITITENATFDIVDYFRNGFDLGGRGTGGGDIIAVSFNATAGKGFIQRYSSTSADNFNVTVIGGSFRNLNDSIIDANSFNVIAGTYFANESVARINVDNFNVTTGTYFANNSDSVIRAVSFNVTSERDFVNDTATINVDNFFNVTSGNIFSNIDGAIINADSFNVTAVDDFTNTNSSTINADNVTIEVINFANDINNTATVSSDSLNFILTDDFTHSSTTLNGFNNFSNLTISTDGVFTNTTTLSLDGNLGITANTFTNTGEVVSSDTFALSVAGDFDYSSDFLNNGTITTNALNLQVGGDFSNNDASSDFTWATNDILTVLGSAYIVTASFDNSGTITVIDNSLNVTADTITNNSLNITADTFINTGSATANILNLNVVGHFDYSSDYLNNGTINENILNLIVGGNFIYDDPASDFTWDAQNSLIVLGNANITTDNYIQAGAIDVSGDWIVNANNFTYNSPSIDFIWDTNDILVVSGNADITTNNFTNDGNISAETLAISVAGDFNYSSDFLNNGTNTADNLNFTARNGAFTNTATIDLAGNLAITANTFTNTGGVVSSDTLALSVAGDFDYKGTITANTYNLNVGGDFSYDYPTSDFTWGANDSLVVSGNADITATDFTNAGTISVNAILNITATSTADNSFENTGGVAADIFNLSVTGDFDYANNGTLTTSAFNLIVGGNFIYDDSSSDFTWDAQNSLIVLGNADITTDNYTQNGAIDVTGALTINVESDFDYVGDFNGTIDFNSLNLNVGGNFIYNDSANDFIWGDNDSLVVSGNAGITTNNFNNGGSINVTGSLDIYAESNFFNSGNVTVTGDLAIEAENNFFNSGSITTESLNITAGYTAINQGSIVSASLDITTDDFFRNLTGGDIAVDTLNITAGGKVTNTATIDVAGTLSIIANDDSSRTNDTTGFYVSNRGNITAIDFNIAAVDNFYNRGNITATNFNITRAKSVFFLNKEIDSFYAAGNTYDGGNISLTGDSSFIAAGGVIENYGNIDLGSNNLDITADSFTNKAGANVTADTLNLDVSSFVQHGTINATVEFK